MHRIVCFCKIIIPSICTCGTVPDVSSQRWTRILIFAHKKTHTHPHAHQPLLFILMHPITLFKLIRCSLVSLDRTDPILPAPLLTCRSYPKHARHRRRTTGTAGAANGRARTGCGRTGNGGHHKIRVGRHCRVRHGRIHRVAALALRKLAGLAQRTGQPQGDRGQQDEQHKRGSQLLSLVLVLRLTTTGADALLTRRGRRRRWHR